MPLRGVGRDSSVGIATLYALDGPGIESRWGGRGFSHPSKLVLGPSQPHVQWVPGLTRGIERPGRGVDQPPRLKKEYSYTSTPPLGLRALLQGNLYSYLYQ